MHWARLAGVAAVVAAGLAVADEPSPPSMPAQLFEGPVLVGERAARGFEAEALLRARMVHARGGQASHQDMRGFGPGWSGDAQLFFNAPERGARLVLEVPALARARYAVELVLTQAPDYGVLRFELDGRRAGREFDGYAATVRSAGRIRIGEVVPHEGRLLIEARLTRRNRRSQGYFAGIDRVVLVPLAAPPAQ